MKAISKAMLIASAAFCLNVSTFAQNVSLNINNVTVKEAMAQLKKTSGYSFIFSSSDVNIRQRVSISAQNATIRDVIDQMLKGQQGLEYEIQGKKIILRKKQTQTSRSSKNIKISGTVLDAQGEAVIGATVTVKGSTNGVTTDMDGKYTLSGVKAGDVLEFRFIGYKVQQVVVKKQTTINVRMEENSETLDDVVVIGYGQQKKGSVVSSINTIGERELAMPTRSLSNNIAGQIAGVLAVQRSGEPGRDDAQFWIRGISSFAGGTSPLVLVDGVPRSMSDIGVDEIESFTVLKDAAATAVYGAEGANGVVLITSKRGKAQKATLDVRTEFGVAKPTRLPKLMNSYEYASLFNEAAWEVAGNPTKNFEYPYSEHALEMYRTGADPDLYPNANFLDLLNDRTFNERVTLNLRGGTDRVRYFLSGAFYHENGIYDSKASDKYDANIGLSRYNIRSNIDIDVTKTTELSVDISGQYTDSRYPGASTENIWSNMFGFAPNQFPLIFSDGTISESKLYNGETANPYNLLNESGYKTQWEAYLQSKIVLNQKLDFITKGLSLKLSGSFDADYYSETVRSKVPTSYRLEVDKEGNRHYIMVNEGRPDLSDPQESGKGGEKQIYLEAALNYKRLFNDLHDVSGIILYMQKERQSQGNGLPFKKQSVVARASYGYDSRYLLEASFGLTGSENFAKGHRYGIFPAVGAAWYVSNEAFMKPIENIVNKLKVRLSYGITGNDAIGGSRFPYRGSLQGGNGYNFGFADGPNGNASNGYGGLIEGQFAAPYLSWEIEEKKNVGIDLGLFGGRVDLSVDFFKNDRKDILMQRKSVSSVAGFRQNPWQNFGKVSNKGLDGNIVLKQRINKVNLSFRGNFTFAKNKVVEYDEVNPQYEYQRYTGNSLGKPMLLIADGLYRNSDFDIIENADNGSKQYILKSGLPVPSGEVRPGDIKYRDINNDGKIDSYDATYDHKYKSENPEIVYGFGLNAEWKGFYAGVFFQGVGKASINLKSGKFIPFTQGELGAVGVEAKDHWSSSNPDNTNTLFPRLHTANFAHNSYESTWWYRDGSFLRLKNIEFGYNFKENLLNKLAIKHARIYVQGNNLAVWDDIKMWDPELGSAAGGARYPINRTWTMGLELTF